MEKKNHTYEGEKKIQVVEDIIYNGLSYREALRKYFPHITTVNYIDKKGRKISNDNNAGNYYFITRWVKLYKAEGRERLMQDMRGRKSNHNKKPKKPVQQAIYPSEKELLSILYELISVREKAGLTRSELSSLIGMSTDYIAKMERKNTVPNLKTFLAILMACKVSPNKFFTELKK